MSQQGEMGEKGEQGEKGEKEKGKVVRGILSPRAWAAESPGARLAGALRALDSQAVSARQGEREGKMSRERERERERERDAL